MQPQPNKLENLDDLMAQSEHYANHSMRNIGRLPPTLFLIGLEGLLMFMPESLADEDAKDDFATTARLMCIAHAATSVVMALEAWVKYAKAGEKFDETEAPSEAFDRQEVVVLLGESRTGQKQKFLPIIRSDNGKFFGFGESEVPDMDEMKGRFAQLLPTKVPDEGESDRWPRPCSRARALAGSHKPPAAEWPVFNCPVTTVRLLSFAPEKNLHLELFLTDHLCFNHGAMTQNGIHFWAKTTKDGQPGISVRDHCFNVGCIADAILAALPSIVRGLLPAGSASLAAFHDIGKITIGFQAKCPLWFHQPGLPAISMGEACLSVSDHALVSQVFLQHLLTPTKSHLWAVAVGAHHGKPKGRNAKLNPGECLSEWTHDQRQCVARELLAEFGSLPDQPPDDRLKPFHSDLWLLAGLITVADWIGSNEIWFSPETGMTPHGARQQASEALGQIGWPGGKLRQTTFSAAFGEDSASSFQPNPIQHAVADASQTPGIIIVEGPMGCGKTEAALFAAEQLIVSGHQHGIYFALPTQVTSNRIHERIGRFLRNTLADTATFRLAHSHAWLEDDFNLELRPAYPARRPEEQEEVIGTLREARSWFASAKQALLAPYGVGTIDQALQAVVAVKHFFVRRFALAGKVVVLDEVHSYDIYTGTLITALIHELMNLRCSVIILSATLTAARRRQLLEAAGVTETDAPTAYPLVTAGAPGEVGRHTIPEWNSHKFIALRPETISEGETLAELISRAEAGQHVLWIRNTVIEAQDAFRKAAGSLREGAARVGLLHSRFPFQRRVELENDWLERLGRNRPTEGPGSVLIATQVAEQSVDIDLDFIVSDLAPTDMLLQRVGRLWRHERRYRHTTKPEFWIRLPELSAMFSPSELKKALGRSARVYAPYVLLRTAAVWNGRKELALPHDIRPLLEATYVEPDTNEPEAWQQLHTTLQKEKNELAANAEAATLVLGRPMLQDEDTVLTRRKSAPTTPVILLRSIEQGASGGVLLGALDGSRMEVNKHEWRKSSARFLHRWLVRVPRWMLPVATQKPRWLTLHTPPDATVALVREGGRLSFGDQISSVTFDPQIGIFAECPGKPNPQWSDDDEFDS